MELDFSQPQMAMGIIVFPDYPFGDQPKSPSAINETVVITGSTSNSINITGTVDNQE